VYYAGDTGFGSHFAEIRERCGPMRLAILPIGAFRPEWFMARVHVAPEEALEAHRIVEARTSLAIHFGTFRLADDGQDEAPQRLRAAMAASAETTAPFWIPEFGEGRDLP
jgi:L-ascorbate metabolism protein UlaG (beta-lactamase superfamily)